MDLKLRRQAVESGDYAKLLEEGRGAPWELILDGWRVDGR